MVGTVKMSQYHAFHTKVCHTQQKGRQPGEEPVWHREVSEAGIENCCQQGAYNHGRSLVGGTLVTVQLAPATPHTSA